MAPPLRQPVGSVARTMRAVMAARGLSQVAFATLVGIAESRMHHLMVRYRGSRISADEAILLERYSGIPAMEWLTDQVRDDLKEAHGKVAAANGGTP